MRLLAVPFVFLVGCAAHVTPDQVSAVLATAGNVAPGGALYAERCVDCHHADGLGERGAKLPDLVRAGVDPAIAEGILSGPSIMPNFVHKLSNQQVADVMVYMHATWGVAPG